MHSTVRTDHPVLVRNNVRVTGNPVGRPIVFAHGFGCDQGMWDRLLPTFRDAHQLVLFDLVGAGASDLDAYDPIKYSTLGGHASDVVEICRVLELEDVVLVGHSVSAMIVALAAIEAPELVSDVVMVAPSPCYVDDPSSGYVGGFTDADIDGLLDSLDSNYYAWAAAMAPMIMGNPSAPELGEQLSGSFCRTDPDLARAFATVTFRSDCRPLMPRLTTRTLLLQCSEDMLAPPEVGRYLQRTIPDSTLVELAATGHCPHVSAPEETGAAIRRHLDRG
jgi:sigma-B regulation protein RsbQ